MTPPLGTYGDSSTPPLARQVKRDGREGIKLAQRALTESVSSRLCWYCAGTGTVVDIGSSLVAHVSGIRRCGSPWSCLLCAPVIRERRATEIDTGVSNHLSSGGSALFVTWTLSHHITDALAPRLDAVTEALRHVLGGAPWAKRKTRLGFVGAIRAVEITDGINGWHPHNHSLLLFDRILTDAEVEDLSSWALGRWGGVVQAKGFGRVNSHGLDVRRVTDAAELSSYLTKIDGGWGVGLELARSDVKRNSPLQHLRDFATTGDMASAARWVEYERATYGKRSLRWSPGLRARLLGVEAEVSDAELAASEGLDLTLMRAVIPREVWDPRVKGGTATALLTELEQIAGLILAMCPNPQPLEVPSAVPR